MDAIYYFFAALMIAVGLAQSSILPHIRIANYIPDLMLTLVVAWSVLRGARQGLLWALMGGLTLDVLSGAPFGTFSASLAVASLVSSLGAAQFFRSYALLPVIAIVTATVFYYGSLSFILLIAGRSMSPSDILRGIVLPALGLNALLMLIVFPVTRWLHRSTTSQEFDW